MPQLYKLADAELPDQPPVLRRRLAGRRRRVQRHQRGGPSSSADLGAADAATTRSTSPIPRARSRCGSSAAAGRQHRLQLRQSRPHQADVRRQVGRHRSPPATTTRRPATAGRASTFSTPSPARSSPRSYANGTSTDPNANGIAKIANWVDDTLIDNSTQYVYAGDLGGNLWRFDISTADARPAAGLHVGDAGNQPITVRPELGLVKDATGTSYKAIFFGTGRYLGFSDLCPASPSQSVDAGHLRGQGHRHRPRAPVVGAARSSSRRR